MTDFTFYYGASSGQQRSALRRLEPEAVAISYSTQNNKPWPGNYKLFIDSGGYHHMSAGTGTYETTITEYLDYIRETKPDLWAFRDYPCEPSLLKKTGRTVEKNQQLTTEAAINTIQNHDIQKTPGQPVTVIQGWTKQQYLNHLKGLKERGLLTDYVGIGSICRRAASPELADIIISIRERLPERCKLHAFGLDSVTLKYIEVVDAIDSVDSGAYDFEESHVPGSRPQESYTWRDCARAYLNWRHDMLSKAGTWRLETVLQQKTLNKFSNPNEAVAEDEVTRR